MGGIHHVARSAVSMSGQGSLGRGGVERGVHHDSSRNGGGRSGLGSGGRGGGGRGGRRGPRRNYVPGALGLGPYLGDCLLCEKLSVKLNKQFDANHLRNACPNKIQYDSVFGPGGFGKEFTM